MKNRWGVSYMGHDKILDVKEMNCEGKITVLDCETDRIVVNWFK